ncbi:unnamed protein product [Tetraodon nigroviridis]|uniref:Chromosome 17 SCAF15006, whole genome shotgun sequence n=1 Tax=Tetraodon nigroviridis TaxID=99883 RepID=Q4RQ57_TETNG|nr:unnamed protein product [Tetraodon nigroviridis]
MSEVRPGTSNWAVGQNKDSWQGLEVHCRQILRRKELGAGERRNSQTFPFNPDGMPSPNDREVSVTSV